MRLRLTKQLQSFFLALPIITSVYAAPRTSDALGRRATVCNGHAELCDRQFSSVAFVGAHDSYAIGVDNLVVNQDQNVTVQLDDGIRMLQMQVHNENGELRLCHSSCPLYDGGTLRTYLNQVRTWLDANPNEVLSLLIVNIDNVPVAQYDTVFRSAGLDALSFSPSSTFSAASWPTLGSMIDAGTRLVTFMDNGADFSVPYIIDEFTYIWETEFNVIDLPFDCEVNRTNANVDIAATGQMYLINHFLDKLVLGQAAPFVERLNETNAASGPNSLGEHVDACTGQHSRPPNFLLVDFYEFGGGSVFEVAARINNVAYNPTKPIAIPVMSGSGTTASASSSSRPLNNNEAMSVLNPFSHEIVLCSVSVITAMILGPYLTF